MDLELKDKVVIITGGTGGIGSAIVEDFLNEGAIVIMLYRNPDKKNTISQNISGKGISIEKLISIKLDICKDEEIRKMTKEIFKKYGSVDVLVNCAGFAYEKPFLLLEDEEIRQMIDLNFYSPMFLTRAVLRPMLKQKRGSIINISSLSTHAWGRGITIYASAKAALERFSQTLAQEVGKKGIRVNVVCPGVIDTEMSLQIRRQHEELIMNATSSKKYGLPDEVSKAVLFLASEKTSSFINGHILKVDGGFNL